jgi:hypothetical protein
MPQKRIHKYQKNVLKTFNITRHKGSTNQNHNEVSPD